MTIWGYCRCSTDSLKQDISRQERELKSLGVIDKKHIYKEYESGRKEKRIELMKLLDVVGEGDTIVATEVSRITRSTKQLCEIIEFAKERKLKLIFGELTVDCSKEDLDPMVEGMIKLIGVFAEMEASMIRARVKSGVKNYIEKGGKMGRPETTINDIPNMVRRYYEKYLHGDINKKEYATLCNISRPSLNKYIDLMSKA